MKTNIFLSVTKKTTPVVASLLLNVFSLQAQVADSNAAGRLIRYEVKPEYYETFRKLAGDYVHYALGNSANLLAEAYYQQDAPSTLWIIERWANTTARNKSSNSAQFKALEALSATALVQPPKTIYVQDLEPLVKKEWRKKPGKNDQPITIMLFVDSKPGTENNFKDVYQEAMPKFRSEAGVINYQLSQFENDSTQFVTYEKFRNEDAFQYHLGFPPIQPVIDYLNTSIKQKPFQTGLHRLVAFAPYE
ncbi:MAG: antibiotic biosynthesis monooxygenase [Chitinophagaceae bacterium]